MSDAAETFGPRWIAALLLLALGCGACADAEVPRRPNVALITIDTLRADHCSGYGYSRETTPFLDRLAAAGARFEIAYAPMAVTGPSHATLFTSLSPIATGVLRNGVPLGTERTVLAEILGEEGFETAAFVGSYVVSHRFGFARGFSRFDDDFEGSAQTFERDRWEGMRVEGAFDRRAADTTDRVVEWLEGRSSERPFFLWVHYFDPHRPYVAPAAYRDRFLTEPEPSWREFNRARYDAEILYTDEQLGRLIRAIDATEGEEQTLVLVTADHGEGLRDHGWPDHGPLLYEEDVRVPLVLRWTGRIRPGTVISTAAALIDVAPTVLDLLEVPRDTVPMQGTSLAPTLIAAAPEQPEREIYLQRRAYATERLSRKAGPRGAPPVSLEVKGEKFALRRGRWKYIEALEEETRELYDLKRDPTERHDVAPQRAEIAENLSQKIDDWRRAQEDLAGPIEREADPEDLERLRALGYLP
jgi:arylsulfatase A-like enzyme